MTKHKPSDQAAHLYLWNVHRINCRADKQHCKRWKDYGRHVMDKQEFLRQLRQTHGNSSRCYINWKNRNNTGIRAEGVWPRYSAAQKSASSEKTCYRPLTVEGVLSKQLLWELLSVANDGRNAPAFFFTACAKWNNRTKILFGISVWKSAGIQQLSDPVTSAWYQPSLSTAENSPPGLFLSPKMCSWNHALLHIHNYCIKDCLRLLDFA